ncbi:MAPEG family protein [Sinimarinibacterium flocculans]|uniref:MAPEG family protein n=1 Tax=Sinimarinibacterium flocculans TaxID=985250 RepID=UPI0035192446
MPEFLLPYGAVVAAFGATGVLILVQMLVADVAGIRARHVPGAPVPTDHGLFLFRAVRAHANTNESVAAFVLLSLFGIFNGADAQWLGILAWTYVGGRVAHMLCYYADQRLLRSLAFAIALLALLAMAAVGALG